MNLYTNVYFMYVHKHTYAAGKKNLIFSNTEEIICIEWK